MRKAKWTERRSHPRMEMPVLLRPKSLFGQKSRVQNIGIGGLRISSQKNFGVGKNLKIQISFPRGEWTDANVRVVWIKEFSPDSGPHYDVGCEFVDLPFDVQNELWVLLDKDSQNH